MTFPFVFWLVAGGLSVAFALIRDKESQEWMAEYRALANEELSKICINSSNPLLAFDAMDAEVMEDKEEVIANGNQLFLAYALNRIVRSKQGEYFWMRFDSVNEPKVVVRHMRHSLAKAMLQDKYVEARTIN